MPAEAASAGMADIEKPAKNEEHSPDFGALAAVFTVNMEEIWGSSASCSVKFISAFGPSPS